MDAKWLLGCFWQNENNCASVAVIKAALLQYGPKKIFAATRTDDGFRFKLHSRRVVEITHKEIESLAKKMGIAFDEATHRKKQLEDVRQCVSCCFAIMVTSLVNYGLRFEDNFYTYTRKEAIADLVNESFNPVSAASALGVKISKKHKPPTHVAMARAIRGKKAVILRNKWHVVAMSYRWFDNYGDLEYWDKKWPKINGEKLDKWYGLL